MIRRVVVAVAIALALVRHASAGEPLAKLDSELTRLHTDTALLYPSQAIDEYPLWSPDGRYVAVNVEGEWRQIDFSAVVFKAGTWREGRPLAVLVNQDAVAPASSAAIAEWRKTNKLEPRRVDVGGAQIELQATETSTALVVTQPGGKSEARWQSDLENCHSLVAAPTKHHVAFICEMTGLFLLRVGPTNR